MKKRNVRLIISGVLCALFIGFAVGGVILVRASMKISHEVADMAAYVQNTILTAQGTAEEAVVKATYEAFFSNYLVEKNLPQSMYAAFAIACFVGAVICLVYSIKILLKVRKEIKPEREDTK